MTLLYPKEVEIDNLKLLPTDDLKPEIKANISSTDNLIFHNQVTNDYYRFLLPFIIKKNSNSTLIALMMNPNNADRNFPDKTTNILLNHSRFKAGDENSVAAKRYQHIYLINVIPFIEGNSDNSKISGWLKDEKTIHQSRNFLKENCEVIQKVVNYLSEKEQPFDLLLATGKLRLNKQKEEYQKIMDKFNAANNHNLINNVYYRDINVDSTYTQDNVDFEQGYSEHLARIKEGVPTPSVEPDRHEKDIKLAKPVKFNQLLHKPDYQLKRKN
ncbi:DUF1643 domain-containing protein [Lentilactobacillus raoultii]|uniref:DUF1643 domain-containing protein n=1 Tax=Lentilactobacillus raoultii TaxID=1987503 RepID=A0ABW3PGL1_9LACO|nr:DUF1643 domain-containing protein [Lentilactobacillus raoultii]